MNMFEYENQGSGSYLVYKVRGDEEVNTFVLGMVSNNNLEGISKMSKVQMDGEIQIRYPISAKRQLAEYLKNERMTRDTVLEMLYRIVQTIINARDYMIREDEFILDVQYIYVDMNTKKPCLILSPIKDRGMVNETIDIFVKNFIYSIGHTDEILINTINKIMGMLNQCNGIIDFRDAIRLEMSNKSIAQAGAYVDVSQKFNNGANNVGNVAAEQVKNINVPKVEAEQKKEIPKVEPKRDSEPRKGSLFSIPGLDAKDIPFQEEKDDSKEKKGLFGLKLGKEKKKEDVQNIQIPNEPHKQIVVQSNIRSNVVPVIPTNVEPPKKEVPTEYMPGSDSNTIMIGGYENDTLPYLYRTKSGENIQITKDYFKLGKSNSTVDYQIMNNNAISNFHMAIICRNGEYFAVDAGSTNYTYVEGTKLEPNQEVKLTNDTHIRMANEEFVFKIM